MRSRWEVVLLYLLEVGSVEEREPREEATQRGISEGLGIPLPHMPRIMSSLISEGLVRAEKEHVKGRRRRVLLYRLTPQGLKRARELWEEAMEEVVEVGGRRMRLGDVRTQHPSYKGLLTPLLLGHESPVGVVGEEEGPRRPPQWYIRLRGEVLDNLKEGARITVEPWEAPYMAGLLAHQGGFKPAGREGPVWHLRKGSISVTVGPQDEGVLPESWTPGRPTVEKWIEAFPRLSEMLRPLYRISGGEVEVLKFLEGREEEVLQCLSERSPQDCALLFYLKYREYRARKENAKGGEQRSGTS